MPIIAPHIAAAESELDALQAQYSEAREALKKIECERKPTLFVEGPTEYKLYKALLERFRPATADQIYVAMPPARAGANYVTNMLRAWEYKNKHLLVEQRLQCVGIVDADNEGLSAKKRFSDDIRSPKQASVMSLGVPKHLTQGINKGLQLPISLEYLWAPDVWIRARERDWLDPCNPSDGINASLACRVIDGAESLNSILNEEEQLYLKHRPRDASKTEWLEFMLDEDDLTLETQASEFLAILDIAIGKLGVSP